MEINTELYKNFYMVAREGSISKAAEVLYISQPAVTRSIQQLEEKSGCSLFFRTPKGMKLTKEGETLFKYIEQAFNFIAQGEKKLSEIKELLAGEITIGVGDTICKHYLLPHLKNFNHAYPGVRIHVRNHTTPVIIDMLKKGLVDLGIVNLPVADTALKIHKIMDIQDCFVVGERYKGLTWSSKSIAEIVQYPLLLLEQGSNSRIYIDEYLARHQIRVKPEIELGNFELLVQFAMIDFGVACVIRNFIAYELEKSLLYEVKLQEVIPPRHIGIAYLNTLPLSAAASRFLSFLLP